MHIRALQESDSAAVITLINADQLPFQPHVTHDRLHKAIIGDADIDRGWWDDLSSVHTLVCVEESHIVGAAEYGIHTSGEQGYILWMHTHEQSRVITQLLTYMLNEMQACSTIYAFWIATPLTWGIEGLPYAHRQKTHQALKKRGFIGSDMWLYMAGPVIPGTEKTAVIKQEGRGYLLSFEENGAGTANSEVSMGEGTVGALWWIGVEEAHRGKRLGKQLFQQSQTVLAEAGAASMILYVDHDNPQERDRRAAISMYTGQGFFVVDHLWSYELKLRG